MKYAITFITLILTLTGCAEKGADSPQKALKIAGQCIKNENAERLNSLFFQETEKEKKAAKARTRLMLFSNQYKTFKKKAVEKYGKDKFTIAVGSKYGLMEKLYTGHNYSEWPEKAKINIKNNHAVARYNPEGQKYGTSKNFIKKDNKWYFKTDTSNIEKITKLNEFFNGYFDNAINLVGQDLKYSGFSVRLSILEMKLEKKDNYFGKKQNN